MLKQIFCGRELDSCTHGSGRMPLLLILFCVIAPSASAGNFRFHSYQAQSTSSQSNPPEIATLGTGVTVEREIRSGHKHSYQLVLNAGQYAKVTIRQRGVDVDAKLFGPDGKLIADVDADPAFDGSEKIELVADRDGNFKIVIDPSWRTGGAGSYVLQFSETHAASADEKLLDEARRQFYESSRAKSVDESIELATKSMETRRKILGPDHADVAASYQVLGNFYRSKNKLDEAGKLLQQAAEVTLKLSGETLVYSVILIDLARLHVSMGDYTRAEQLNDQALAIRQKLEGPEGLLVSEAVYLRATMSRAVNNLPRAEENFRRVVAIREKLLAPDDPLMANVLNDFGLFYYGAGDYDSAEALMQRALAIREKALGPDHVSVGATLNNLGLIEVKRGNDDKGESYYLRALRIFEKANPESDRVASQLVNLGIVYRTHRNYAKAEEYYLRGLAIHTRIYGENHLSTAVTLSSLGILYREMGNFELAEKYSLRALAVNEKMLGPNHQNTILTLNAMARLYGAKGDLEKAIEYLRRVRDVEERIIPLNQTLGSERQKLAYFNRLPTPDKVISFHVRNAPENPQARDLAATMVLQRKGRVLDALADNFSSLRRRSRPEDQALFDQLGDINSQLSKLVLGGPQRTPIEDYRNQVKALEEKREKLESEIGRRSAGFYAGSQPVSLATVGSVVPSNAALIEFVVYRSFDWRVPDDKSADGEPRYAVYVLRNRGEVRWAHLGTAADLDRAVNAWRQALRDPKRKDVQRLARAVDEKVMQPVRALVGDATELLISPDGELNLIPFAALVDEQGHYLVQRYSFAYLTSGRELLRMQVARASETGPLVVANPAFGEPTTRLASAARPSVLRNRRSVIAAGNIADVYFAPLSSTEHEAHTIQKLFPDANILVAGQATESAVKQVNAPVVLHIATHGFFLGDPIAKISPAPEAIARADKPSTTRGISQAAPSGPTASAPTRGLNLSANIENPLLRSGLALTNANLRNPGNDDGILTALEASGLNLWGTKLVVLSACDTGVGEVRTGEGVYGLRRAFVLAGAESLVMSLWPVSDYSTRTLMTSYYKNLKQGMGRGAALHQVQLDLLKRNPQLHPFYWANFIQSGEWANLDGKR
jgi:CHAT domain-containing protein/Tfp pilus assembly protein PilF